MPSREPQPPRQLNADLHCHSVISDGTLEVAALAKKAHAGGVELWALTDHDEVSGQKEAVAAAAALGMRYVAGVEISVSWVEDTIHIVGLNIDPSHPPLVDGLARTRAGRVERAREMGDQLSRAGIDGAFEGAKYYAGNPELISRTHFARYLIERGHCDSVHEVFKKYLVSGKPGYVPTQWAGLSEAIDWITESGGTAVVAHPGRYRLNDAELRALLSEFKKLGGAAIEVVTGSHTPDQYRKFATIAREYNFMGSRGADYHGPDESRVELGSLPPLPDSVIPVWHKWL